MVPGRTSRGSLRLPGTARDAHRRNVLVILIYLFVFILLVGVVVAFL